MPLAKWKPIRVCSVEIEVFIDFCSFDDSTALLAVSDKKLNTDILRFLAWSWIVSKAVTD